MKTPCLIQTKLSWRAEPLICQSVVLKTKTRPDASQLSITPASQKHVTFIDKADAEPIKSLIQSQTVVFH